MFRDRFCLPEFALMPSNHPLCDSLSRREAGVLCKAPSESAIKGSIPTVKALGPVLGMSEEWTDAGREQCQLTSSQVAAIREAFAGWNASAGRVLCSFPTIEDVLP